MDETKLDSAIQRLGKWRTLLAGWQLGTRAKGDPEGDAVRDHRELTILLRAEVNALTATMIELIPIFSESFSRHLLEEAILLDKDYQNRFPGVTATDHGLVITERAKEWMKGWRP